MIDKDMDEQELFEAYLEHCRMLQDSSEHINYMINSSKCFEEWVELELDKVDEREHYDNLEAARDHAADNRREDDKLGD